MAQELGEPAVERPILADEYRVDGRLHVVVDAAPRHTLEELECLLVRVEHHLLGFARIGAHEQHPAMAESDLRDLDHRRHTIDDDALVAPVELIRLGRREAQWHIGLSRALALAFRPTACVAAHVIVAAPVAGEPQLLEEPIKVVHLAG